MKELIPSKDVRDYLKEREHIFSDSERATLIYNSDWSLPEKHEALSELGSVTADLELKQQIEERIQWDERCLEQIKDNSGQYVYKLEIWEKEDQEYMNTGIFATWELAEDYAKKSCKKFQIKKMFIYGTTQEWNEDDECDSEVATIRYNEAGAVTDYWGDGLKYDASIMGQRERFEFAFVLLPHPFVEGDIVRVIGTDDVGIVRFAGKETWEELDKKMREWGADYSDVSFPIEVVDENANFGHMHVNPTDVEYAEFEEDDDRASLMWMASQLVQGNAYIQEFQAYCESYIEKKRRPQR